MIIQLEKNVKDAVKKQVQDELKTLNYKTTFVSTQYANYLVGTGKRAFDIRKIGHLSGIKDIHIVSDDYKLVSSKWKINRTTIDLGDGVIIGGDQSLTIMAGPCSIEGEENIKNTLAFLEKNNVKIMRGGVFKPRSSPYSFRGIGIDGLKLWRQLTKEKNIKIITEVMQVSQIEQMYDYVDIYQVGARNTQNFNLLDELGKIDKPVMIKRGISGTLDELLYSAEYVFAGGNEKLLLCERGIRTYERSSRNTFDINAIPILKEKTHLPIIADPSHGIGIRNYVTPIALAATIAGADGVIFEMHEKPEEAMSDKQQTLNYEESKDLIDKLKKLNTLSL